MLCKCMFLRNRKEHNPFIFKNQPIAITVNNNRGERKLEVNTNYLELCSRKFIIPRRSMCTKSSSSGYFTCYSILVRSGKKMQSYSTLFQFPSILISSCSAMELGQRSPFKTWFLWCGTGSPVVRGSALRDFMFSRFKESEKGP